MVPVRIDRCFLYASSDMSVIKHLGCEDVIEKMNELQPFLRETLFVHDINHLRMRFVQLVRSFLAIVWLKGCRPVLDNPDGKTLLENVTFVRKGNVLTMMFKKEFVRSVNVRTNAITAGKSEEFDKLVTDIYAYPKYTLREWSSLEGLIEDIEDVNAYKIDHHHSSLRIRIVNRALSETRDGMIDTMKWIFVLLESFPNFLEELEEAFKDEDETKKDRIKRLDTIGRDYLLRSEMEPEENQEISLSISNLAFLKADHLRLKLFLQPKNCRVIDSLRGIASDYNSTRKISEKRFIRSIDRYNCYNKLKDGEECMLPSFLETELAGRPKRKLTASFRRMKGYFAGPTPAKRDGGLRDD